MTKELDKKMLKRLYLEKGKTIREVAGILNCSREKVRLGCKQYGIPLRNPGTETSDIDEETLRRLHVKEKRGINESAKIFDCFPSTISRRVKQFGLKNS